MAHSGKKAHVAIKNKKSPLPRLVFHWEEHLAPALFIAALSLYILTSSPSIGWLDSPEFVAQAASLGIAHSPGHPLPALLGKFASLFPVGDLVWRVNLASSLCAATSVSVFFYCCDFFLASSCPDIANKIRKTMAAVMAVLIAVSWAFWSNSLRAEVYALQSLISISGLFVVLKYLSTNRTRELLLAAFIFSLGLANHHLLTLVLLLPSAAIVLIHKGRPSLRRAGFAAITGFIGLSALLYLPIRSLTHPLVNFGAPHTMDRFAWTLSGSAFSGSVGGDHVSTPLNHFFDILVALSDALSLPVLLLAVASTFFTYLGHKSRLATTLLLAITALCIGARVLLGFDPHTPDHHAYLFPAIFCVALLALSGLGQLSSLALRAKRPLPSAPTIAALSLALVIPIALWSNWERTSRVHSWASDDVAHWELEALPPYSLVLTAYFQTTFRQWALSLVEGARPDIVLLDRSFLSYPGMPEEAKRRNPELSTLIDAPLVPGVPSPLELLTTLATQRPLFVQQHPNVDQALARTLRPAGAFAIYRPTSKLLWAVRDREMRAALAAIRDRATLPDDYEAQGTLLWHDATRLELYCVLGDRSAALEVFRDAVNIAPKDEMLQEMAIRCGLTQ